MNNFVIIIEESEEKEEVSDFMFMESEDGRFHYYRLKENLEESHIYLCDEENSPKVA